MNPQERLRLEHIAPYLPYGLNTQYRLGDVIGHLEGYKADEIRDKKLVADNVDFVMHFCKPILRPLSDLTKQIEINGEVYEPNMELGSEAFDEDFEYFTFSDRKMTPEDWSYSDVSLLFEWHFDVFGLIEKGLAIDFNQLKLTDN